MRERNDNRLLNGVSRNRWLFGIVTATLILGTYAAAGLVMAGSGQSGSTVAVGPPLSIRMTIAGMGSTIEIDSFQWGVGRAGTSLPPPGSMVKVQSVVITKPLDKSSPILFRYCVEGRAIDNVTIDFFKDGTGTEYLKYELKNVMVSSVTISGNSQSDVVPTESISFNFQKITVNYVQYRESDSLICGQGDTWDICLVQ